MCKFVNANRNDLGEAMKGKKGVQLFALDVEKVPAAQLVGVGTELETRGAVINSNY